MASSYTLELDLPAESIGNIDAKVNQAVKRALRRAVTWLRTESIKRLSQELGINQVALKDRFKIRVLGAGHSARLWIGILPLSAVKLGKRGNKATG